MAVGEFAVLFRRLSTTIGTLLPYGLKAASFRCVVGRLGKETAGRRTLTPSKPFEEGIRTGRKPSRHPIAIRYLSIRFRKSSRRIEDVDGVTHRGSTVSDYSLPTIRALMYRRLYMYYCDPLLDLELSVMPVAKDSYATSRNAYSRYFISVRPFYKANSHATRGLR